MAPTVGLIGCGRWGRNIAAALAREGALAAIAVRRPDAVRAFAEDLRTPLLSVPDLLARADVSAVAIAAAPADHPALARAALDAGKHVFVEKPMAMDGAEARACAEAAERAGLLLMTGHLMLHHPAFRRLAAEVAAGTVGAVRRIESRRWTATPGDSALWMLAPHDISMVLHLCGPPSRLRAEADGAAHRLSLYYPGGMAAATHVARAAPSKRAELVVVGDAGAIVFDDLAADGDKLVLHAGDPGRLAPGLPLAFADEAPLTAEMRAFLDRVRAGRPVPDETAAAVRVVEVLAGLEHSANGGGQIFL